MNKRVGEITKATFNDTEYKGARIRAFDEIPKPLIDNEPKVTCLRDFNLYDEIDECEVDTVKYYDPNRTSSTSFTKVDTVRNTNIIERLYNNFTINKSFVISPYSLLACITLLFRGSTNNSNLNSVLGNKTSLFNKLYDVSKIVKTNNLCLISDNYKLNNIYCEYANNIGRIISVRSLDHANSIIKSNYYTSLHRFLEGISLVSLSKFDVILKQKFVKINNKLVQHYSTHKYYVDENTECLEMEMNNNLLFGIYKSELQEFDINIMQSLRDTSFKTIILSEINEKSKFGLLGLFSKLDVSFDKVEFSEIITSMQKSCSVNDIVSECLFRFTGAGLTDNKTKNNSTLVFDAGRQYTYYVRHKPTNMIVFIGRKN